ncbi:MAG: ABC transporter permease, partial [Agromyces sp.]
MNTTAVVTGTLPVAKPENDGLRMQRVAKIWQAAGPLVIFVAMFAVVASLTPTFVGGGGMTIIASSAAPILLVALGQAFVLNIGSIDLSNAAITVLGAIMLAMTLGPLGAVAPIVVLIMVTAFGAVNGLLIAYAQVPSFALTLGTLGIFQAAALVVSGATTVYVSANSELITPLYTSGIATLPMSFILGVVVAIASWAFLRFTRAGRGMTAVGKNESGAIFSAVRNRQVKVVAYALSGLLSGLASLTIIAQAG